ncbi:unknown [Firmicutes bacterium CAG:460]|nr:unknown [Firmicutes bacterium CAG:460]
MLLKIVIIVILIVINILAFIYIYKNDSDEINYDKWCKMLQDETKDNIELIRKNEKKINELNKEIEKLMNIDSK